MDPKQSGAPNNLDPKLKEAYERVMGLAPNPSVQKVPLPSPASQPSQPQQQTTAPVTHMPTPPSQSMSHATTMPTMQTISKTEPIHLNSQIHGFVASKQKKKSQVSPVVIVLAAVVFMVVYTLIWVKIFNVQLPLSP